MIAGRSQRWLSSPWLANGLFFGALILFCAVIAEGRFFPTVDGPVHSYNARLLGDLLAGDARSTAFFQLSDVPVPYWTSLAFMWLFGILLGPTEVERAIVLLIIIATALAFRSFLRGSGSKSGMADLLIFPFIWTVPLQLGFFNFCLGLALLLFVLGWWLRRSEQKWTARRLTVGMALFVLLYFTHLMLFAMAVALMLAQALWWSWKERSTRLLYARSKNILFLVLPGLVLCAWYFAMTDGEGPKLEALPFAQRVEWLVSMQPLLTLVWDQEGPMARAVQVGLVLLTGAALCWRVKTRTPTQEGDTWGWAAVLLFVGSLVVPDGFSSGSILVVRLQLIGLILWAAWCALQPLHGSLRVLGIAFVLGGTLSHLEFQQRQLRTLRSEAEDLYAITPAVPGNATLLPLSYSGNWLHANFSDYLGTWKNTVVLDNFVARYAHSPIRWRTEMEPFNDIGNFDSSIEPCVDLTAWTKRTGHALDHVIAIQMPTQPTDSCTIDVQRQLRDRYDLAFTSPSGMVKLYRLKPGL